MSNKKNNIAFGTDGWRAIISDDFTFENVLIVAQSIADYVKSQKPRIKNKRTEVYGRKYEVAVGYDTRFMSEKYAELISSVLAGNDIKVILSDRASPTPSVSFTIVDRKLIGGVMVTASHNPAFYNGIKFKGYFGGSVGKEVTDYMESRLGKTAVKFIEKDEAVKKGLLKYDDIVAKHVAAVKKYVDMDLLYAAGLNILVDSMNGAGGLYIENILKDTQNRVATINAYRDPYFGGRSPEPNEVHLASTAEFVKNGSYDVCVVTDGDADRLGVVTREGEILSGHKVMTLLLVHLLENRKLRGGIVQTICGTGLINKIAEKYGLKTYATPVGFKYIGELYIKEDILLGGEETGGVAFKGWLPERDGFLSALLILELMAKKKKPLSEIVRDIEKEYGTFVYKRLDMKLPAPKRKKLLANLSKKGFTSVLGRKVVDVQSYDGYKFVLEDGSWVMLRPSGTEPKLRVYSEAHSESEAVQLIEFGKKYALSV